MTVFACIKQGYVIDIFDRPDDWSQIPPEQLFDEHFHDEWVDLTSVDPPPQWGWTYDGTTFAPPAAPMSASVQDALVRAETEPPP
jgi:hypothetical protein